VVGAVALLLLVGPLAFVVWYFSGSSPARPVPGSLWAEYETQVQSSVRGVGGSIGENGCEMFGNVNAGLQCPVVGVAPHTLLAAFAVAGWKRESSDSTELTNERARLSIHSAQDGSWVKVSVVLRKQ
jgi:hypothetical protein